MNTAATHHKLKEKVVEKFLTNGVREEEAKIIADVLVHANLRGVDSHGVLRVEHYIKRIQAGGLNIEAYPTLEETSDHTCIYDGDNGFGHVISKRAMDKAIAMAKDSGIGSVGVKNSSHCGALSYFVNQAVEEKLIGIAMSHTDKVVVPFGGAEPFFGTNPIAFGFPTKEEKSVVLDLATSNVALGKILDAQEKGEKIPHGWGVDENGASTNDPDQVSFLSPFGGAKGYGLAFVVEVFSALLTGSAFGPHVSKMYGDYAQYRGLGHFFMVINPEKFEVMNSFLGNMDQMIREIHSVKPAESVERVMVPGEPETLEEERRKENGIPLPKHIWDYLNE
ncbi:ureidoglycolate dehydrogenase (NAD+) [Geomicrobium halophilum]|uniref:Ureidoglycolate dehydrogenase (NAD+) n=1 Tax=Geomicrobium halophilum TaxID=549000 RepID=A0A841PLJ8_9BACL|nr:ureidoglycolate dehydrogenase [Geomicrobium halophilum]MBB6448086.1 ureidoglycolate dehydrogenase (NAD+) [Geomicrobium halophilum]